VVMLWSDNNWRLYAVEKVALMRLRRQAKERRFATAAVARSPTSDWPLRSRCGGCKPPLLGKSRPRFLDAHGDHERDERFIAELINSAIVVCLSRLTGVARARFQLHRNG